MSTRHQRRPRARTWRGLLDSVDAAVPEMTARSKRRYRHLIEHHLTVFVWSRLSPAAWGLPLLLDEMRSHPRLLFYGLLYAAWVAAGGLTVATSPFSWPVRAARLTISFLWFYLVLVSLS